MVDRIKSRLKKGETRKEVRDDLKGELDVPIDSIDAALDKAEKENDAHTFWTKSEKGAIKVVALKLKSFLEDNGFYKYSPAGGKKHVFVKVTNNMVDDTNPEEIKDFVLKYLLMVVEDESVYNYFAENVFYFRSEFLTFLDTVNIHFVQDTKKKAFLYFRNCAIEVSKSDVKIHDYLDIDGFVWKDHVINRDFHLQGRDHCDFSKFVSCISGGDKDRIDTLESTIGYLLHSYKNLSYSPAVILNDEMISDNPEGGTGKGLLLNGVSKMKKLVVIDGKQFKFDKPFAYQLVSVDTQIILFDDVRKNFEFERLFSVITEGLTLEKKNKDAINIPREKSPKVAITTNYAIKGVGNSHARRKWEVELHPHFNRNNTPEDEFGRLFFDDWDELEWSRFDNYMVGCLMKFLSNGLIKSDFVNLEIRQLSAATNHEFIEWCGLLGDKHATGRELLRPNTRIHAVEAYRKFIEDYPDYDPKGRIGLSQIRFNTYLNAYAIYISGNPAQFGRDSQGKWFVIVLDEDKGDHQNKLQI